MHSRPSGSGWDGRALSGPYEGRDILRLIGSPTIAGQVHRGTPFMLGSSAVRRWAVTWGAAVAVVMAAASLAPAAMAAGSISGTVTDASGTPLSGIWVTAFKTGAPPRFEPNQETDSAGHYTLPGLDAGQWTVYFLVSVELPGRGPNYLPEFYDNQPSEAAATPVIVGDDAVTGIDAALTRGGTISGTVTEEGNPLPIEACVSVGNGKRADYYDVWSTDGSYRITGLPTDNYFVVFTPCDVDDGGASMDDTGISECFDNVAVPSTRTWPYPWDCGSKATRVPVITGQDVTGINASVKYFRKPYLYIKGRTPHGELNLTAKLSAGEAATVKLTGKIAIERGASYDFKKISEKLRPGKKASHRLVFSGKARRAAKEAFSKHRSVFLDTKAIFKDNSGFKYRTSYRKFLR